MRNLQAFLVLVLVLGLICFSDGRSHAEGPPTYQIKIEAEDNMTYSCTVLFSRPGSIWGWSGPSGPSGQPEIIANMSSWNFKEMTVVVRIKDRKPILIDFPRKDVPERDIHIKITKSGDVILITSK